MLSKLTNRRYLALWQVLFLFLGTSWLWAPHLNTDLSYRTSLISQYETPSQPYSWIFRIGDVLSSSLILLMAYYCLKRPSRRTVGWLLLVIGIGLFSDPLFTTTCRSVGNGCSEYFSMRFVLHAAETIITSAAFFAIAIYDAQVRKKLVSIGFALFQIGYGLLFVTQLANQNHFNTASQYAYEAILIVWLAWFCRDYLLQAATPSENEISAVRLAASAWAFINGILAILISLAHIHLLGRIKGLYFAGDSAWLAQHGVIIGVVMLYLSRHLARGELRARQIFLGIAGIEALKYSVISPNPGLMSLYLLTFTALFIFRDDFDRGSIPMTWEIKLKDLYFMVAGLLLAVAVALFALDRDNKISIVASRSFDNFFDYVAGSDIIPRSHIRSAVLAHTISAFLVFSIGSILWILFRPYKKVPPTNRNDERVKQSLMKYSKSSEDFFKLWPEDKDYFWGKSGASFIAYRIVGPVAFALADPIASNKRRTLNEFISWCRARRLKVCFLPVYEESLEIYKKAGLDTIQIGSSAVINQQDFLANTSNDKWWRWQKNRAAKSGYIYDISRPPHFSVFLQQLRAVSDAWLDKGQHAERGFALGYFDENYLQECPIHYLKDESGRILAFTNQLPEFNPSEMVTIDLLRYLPEQNNTMPFLLYKTIGSISENNEGKFFDLGFVPFAKAKGPLLAIARTLSAGRFSSRGLEQFKNKFNPDWRPNYMAYEGDLADLAMIALHLERAMDTEI